MSDAVTKNDILMKLVSTCIGLAASLAITYIGFKQLANILDPTQQEKKEAQKRAAKLLEKIGIKDTKLTEYELCIASNLVEPLSMSVSWRDIGGLDSVINDIINSVILPFKHTSFIKSSALLKPPTGVLLHGPPGCGKTMLAKAMAKAAGGNFINLQVSSLVDKWYGESQKRAEAVFSLATKLEPTIIFIDEIDSFLRSRTTTDNEATAMIKTQFMSFWDGLTTDRNNRIMIVGATNRPSDVDAAILRRMPSMFYVGYPDTSQRERILSLIIKDEQIDVDVDLSIIARDTEGLSGSDLRELCRDAAMLRLQDLVLAERELMSIENEEEFHDCAESKPSSEDGELRALTMSDLQTALAKLKSSKVHARLGNIESFAMD